MTNKFKIGDIIKFKNCTDQILVKEYNIESSDIRPDLIKHGDVYFKDGINKGTIVDIYKDFYIISVETRSSQPTQLGWKEEALELLIPYIPDPSLDHLYKLLEESRKAL